MKKLYFMLGLLLPLACWAQSSTVVPQSSSKAPKAPKSIQNTGQSGVGLTASGGGTNCFINCSENDPFSCNLVKNWSFENIESETIGVFHDNIPNPDGVHCWYPAGPWPGMTTTPNLVYPGWGTANVPDAPPAGTDEDYFVHFVDQTDIFTNAGGFVTGWDLNTSEGFGQEMNSSLFPNNTYILSFYVAHSRVQRSAPNGGGLPVAFTEGVDPEFDSVNSDDLALEFIFSNGNFEAELQTPLFDFTEDLTVFVDIDESNPSEQWQYVEVEFTAPEIWGANNLFVLPATSTNPMFQNLPGYHPVVSINNYSIDQIKIEEKMDITVNEITNAFCPDYSDGSIDLDYPGNILGVSWMEEGSEAIISTSADLTDVPAGTYSVLVTNANLCQQTFTFTIENEYEACSFQNCDEQSEMACNLVLNWSFENVEEQTWGQFNYDYPEPDLTHCWYPAGPWPGISTTPDLNHPGGVNFGYPDEPPVAGELDFLNFFDRLNIITDENQNIIDTEITGAESFGQIMSAPLVPNQEYTISFFASYFRTQTCASNDGNSSQQGFNEVTNVEFDEANASQPRINVIFNDGDFATQLQTPLYDFTPNAELELIIDLDLNAAPEEWQWIEFDFVAPSTPGVQNLFVRPNSDFGTNFFNLPDFHPSKTTTLYAIDRIQIREKFEYEVVSVTDESCPDAGDGSIDVTVPGNTVDQWWTLQGSSTVISNDVDLINANAGDYEFTFITNDGCEIVINETIGLIDTECCGDPTATPQFSNGDVQWLNDLEISADYTVQAGDELVISGASTIRFAEDVRLIVEPNAKVIVQPNCVLTALCPDKLWGGIELEGVSTFPQVASFQGTAELNSCRIEYAHVAVNCTETNGGVPVPGRTGGYAIADGTTFLNNELDVNVINYNFNNSFTNNNVFTDCNFRLDINYDDYDGGFPFNRVYLEKVYNVRFEGCDFFNFNQQLLNLNGSGDFTCIKAILAPCTLIYEDANSNGAFDAGENRTRVVGFTYGVYAFNSNTNAVHVLEECQFRCFRGAFYYKHAVVDVTHTSFRPIPPGYPVTPSELLGLQIVPTGMDNVTSIDGIEQNQYRGGYGLYFLETKTFSSHSNTFNMENRPLQDGFIVRATQTNNLIYGNDFINIGGGTSTFAIETAAKFIGQNRNATFNTGLNYWCNNFSNNRRDVGVYGVHVFGSMENDPNFGVKPDQGWTTFSAGNDFDVTNSESFEEQIFDFTNGHRYWMHNSDNSMPLLNETSNNVILIAASGGGFCNWDLPTIENPNDASDLYDEAIDIKKSMNETNDMSLKMSAQDELSAMQVRVDAALNEYIIDVTRKNSIDNKQELIKELYQDYPFERDHAESVLTAFSFEDYSLANELLDQDVPSSFTKKDKEILEELISFEILRSSNHFNISDVTKKELVEMIMNANHPSVRAEAEWLLFEKTGQRLLEVIHPENVMIDYNQKDEVSISKIGSEVRIYPNPTEGLLNIELKFNPNINDQFSVQVFDAVGKEVMVSNWNNSMMHNLDLSELEGGAYIVKVLDNKTVLAVDRLIKK